jgi:hypothetical protein
MSVEYIDVTVAHDKYSRRYNYSTDPIDWVTLLGELEVKKAPPDGDFDGRSYLARKNSESITLGSFSCKWLGNHRLLPCFEYHSHYIKRRVSANSSVGLTIIGSDIERQAEGLYYTELRRRCLIIHYAPYLLFLPGLLCAGVFCVKWGNRLNLRAKQSISNSIQDNAGNTPLMTAILYNDNNKTKEILEQGTNVELRNSAGESALTLGLQRQLPPDLMLDILGKTKHTNQRTLALQTPLQLALESGHPSTVIKKLIKKGAKTDFVTKTGETALILAAKYSEEPEIIGILLKEGVNPNHADQAKRTAIEYAKENEKINGTSEFWLLHDGSSS